MAIVQTIVKVLASDFKGAGDYTSLTNCPLSNALKRTFKVKPKDNFEVLERVMRHGTSLHMIKFSENYYNNFSKYVSEAEKYNYGNRVIFSVVVSYEYPEEKKQKKQ